MVWGCWVRGPHVVSSYLMNASISLGWVTRRLRPLTCATRLSCVNRLSTWNVRRIDGIAKRGEVVDVFRKLKF